MAARASGRFPKHQQAVRQLDTLPQNRFEDFLLRFLSDLSFRVQHTRLPLDYRRVDADGNLEKREWFSEKQERQRARRIQEDGSTNLTVYPDFSKTRDETNAMYVSVKSEGGGCFVETFHRIKGRWMLTKAMNCSN